MMLETIRKLIKTQISRLFGKVDKYEEVGYAYYGKSSDSLQLSHNEKNPRRFKIYRKV